MNITTFQSIITPFAPIKENNDYALIICTIIYWLCNIMIIKLIYNIIINNNNINNIINDVNNINNDTFGIRLSGNNINETRRNEIVLFKNKQYGIGLSGTKITPIITGISGTELFENGITGTSIFAYIPFGTIIFRSRTFGNISGINTPIITGISGTNLFGNGISETGIFGDIMIETDNQ